MNAFRAVTAAVIYALLVQLNMLGIQQVGCPLIKSQAAIKIQAAAIVQNVAVDIIKGVL